jgi:colanic acid biosynthesis glycosyl transferase WcaI
MSRIIFLNRYFPPDHSATSQLLGDLAFDLVLGGNEVHVVASQQLYDNPQARLTPYEVLNGVHVHRVPTTQFGRGRLVGRAFDYLSFYSAARRSLLALAQHGDVVVAKTDPPLISIIAMRVAKQRHAILVNWLQDVYPEVAVALGVAFLKGPVLKTIAHLRDRSLKAATANVVLGEHMADIVAARGVARNRIHAIANWCEDESITPVAAHDNSLRGAWGLQDKFVVGYSGNLGRAHEFETVLAAAALLKSHPNIVFLCIGGGHLFNQLAERVKLQGLTNFQLKPYQPRVDLKYSLAVPDVHWVSLRPELEGLIVPSKVYGIAAAGRPMIAICAKDGELPRLIARYQCGMAVEPGQAGDLAQAILRLEGDENLRDEMGRRARAMIEGSLSRRQALEHWRSLLQSLQH